VRRDADGVFGLVGDLVVAMSGDGDDADGAGGDFLNGNLNGNVGSLRAARFTLAFGRAVACFARTSYGILRLRSGQALKPCP
jgi:hypothetical protein